MNIPENLKYTNTHEWLELNADGTARMGITDYAQNAMGTLVFVNLPQVGDEAAKHKPLCEAESVKAVSEVYSPVDGIVADVNRALEDAPERVNEAPYEAWMVKFEEVTGADDLMNAAEYGAYLDTEGDA